MILNDLKTPLTTETLTEDSPIRSLKKYFEDNRKFRIPAYQRGFKWGVTSSDNSEGEVHKLISNLTKAFNEDELSDYFIQGITVCKTDDDKVEIIDGQQRTTFFYLLLCYLSSKGDTLAENFLEQIEIDYCSRDDSKKFLGELKKREQVDVEIKAFDSKESCKQDIHFFRKALKTMDEFSLSYSANFTSSVLNGVKLIYTEVDPLQARRVFSMMNQGKALMKASELIKAAFLSIASRSLPHGTIEKESLEWEINEVRSRFSREWNEWEQWWRTDKVKLRFGSIDIEFLLRLFYMNSTSDLKWKWILQTLGHAKEVEKYNYFKENFISNSQYAKLNFQKLRKLQQQMEQLVSNSKTYNYLGLILNVATSDKIELINYYKDKDWKTIRADIHYYLLKPDFKLIDIVGRKDIRKEAYGLIQKLDKKYVYDKDVKDENDKSVIGAYEEMCRMLLWMNVKEEMNLSNNGEAHRYFNFKIWEQGQRTLEHIYPKSKSVDLNFLNELDYSHLSVHSAGNLVLLYHNENSKFGDKLPLEKKKIYFNFTIEFKSRHLMHSIMVFAKRDGWREKEIIKSQKEFIKQVKELFFGTIENYESFNKTLQLNSND